MRIKKEVEFVTDKFIRDAIINKDAAMIEKVINKYSKLLWSVVATVLINSTSESDVEEIVADTFIHLWNNPEKYEPDKGKLSTYLSMVARNRAIDRYRQIAKKKEVTIDDVALYDNNDPIDIFIENEDKDKLNDCLYRLEEDNQDYLIRKYYYGQKNKDIARAFNISKKQVENKLYQARKKLRELLDDWSD